MAKYPWPCSGYFLWRFECLTQNSTSYHNIWHMSVAWKIPFAVCDFPLPIYQHPPRNSALRAFLYLCYNLHFLLLLSSHSSPSILLLFQSFPPSLHPFRLLLPSYSKWSSSVPEEDLLLLDLRNDVIYLAFAGFSILLGSKCIAPHVRNHSWHAQPLPPKVIVRGKGKAVGMAR